MIWVSMFKHFISYALTSLPELLLETVLSLHLSNSYKIVIVCKEIKVLMTMFSIVIDYILYVTLVCM